MKNITKGAYQSPAKNHGFDFIFQGEIRYGPSYYNIVLDGILIPNRIFGFEFMWDSTSKFLALQEWLTTDYRKGPLTVLTIIDLDNRKFARISKADEGFIKPVKFQDNIIIFEKEYLAIGKKVEFEINLNEIKNWED
jgi:hypothetical protein